MLVPLGREIVGILTDLDLEFRRFDTRLGSLALIIDDVDGILQAIAIVIALLGFFENGFEG